MSLQPIASNPNIDDKTSKDYYFDSYSHYAIHEEMLKDEVRTQTYRKAILWNPHLFENKVVMDVGCGTGILSMFAASAGAKCVIAIDCSSIVDSAKKIIEENEFTDKIFVLKSKIEDIVDLPNGIKKVDIIISEWMGYCLFYETMLDTVIYARDRWLKTSGMLFPDKAQLWIAGIEDRAYKHKKINFWDDVYGYKMSCIKEMAISEPLVDNVDAKQVNTTHVVIKEVDLMTMRKEDMNFEVPFKLTVKKDDYLHAVMAYFSVDFTACHTATGFTTSPEANKYTHWKQTIFYLRESLTVRRGEILSGSFKMSPNEVNRRDLDFEISFEFDSDLSKLKAKYHYKMR